MEIKDRKLHKTFKNVRHIFVYNSTGVLLRCYWKKVFILFQQECKQIPMLSYVENYSQKYFHLGN